MVGRSKAVNPLWLRAAFKTESTLIAVSCCVFVGVYSLATTKGRGVLLPTVPKTAKG